MKPIHEQTILVTGATDGIGKQTAIDLASRGATVIVHGRNGERGRAAVDQIVRFTGNENIRFHKADFSSLAEVRRFAAEVQAEYLRSRCADQQRECRWIRSARLKPGRI